MDTWEELEQLCREVEEADATVAERRARTGTEREALRSLLDLIDRQWQELELEAALEQVRERLLGGVGVVQRISAAHGLDRMLALMWPAEVDPRADLSAARGEYRVEVWLGIGEQGRPRVRVVGARRMEAGLPVAVEKFRAVLLGAVRAPAFAPLGEQPESDQPPAQAASEAEATGQESPAPPSAPQPPPPAEDEPIPMGPAASDQATEHPPRRGSRGRDRAEDSAGSDAAAPSA